MSYKDCCNSGPSALVLLVMNISHTRLLFVWKFRAKCTRTNLSRLLRKNVGLHVGLVEDTHTTKYSFSLTEKNNKHHLSLARTWRAFCLRDDKYPFSQCDNSCQICGLKIHPHFFTSYNVLGELSSTSAH